MLEAYNKHVDERAEKNIPPKPLTAEQTQELITLLTSKTCEDKNALVELLDPLQRGPAYCQSFFLNV